MTNECFQQMACAAISIFGHLAEAKTAASKLLSADEICPFLSTAQITALTTTLPALDECIQQLRLLQFVVEL